MSEENNKQRPGAGEDGGEFRPYPPVNHPEDHAGFGQGQQPPQYPSASDQMQNPYGQSNPGHVQQGYDQPGLNMKVHADLNVAMVEPVLDVSVWNPVSYGFKIVFKRANPWLLWGLGLALVSIILPIVLDAIFHVTPRSADLDTFEFDAGYAAQSGLLNFLSYAALVLVAPILIAMAVAQVDGGEIGGQRTVAKGNYAKTLVTAIVAGLIAVVAALVPLLIAGGLIIALDTGGDFTTLQGVILLVGILLAIVLGLLLVPLSTFSAYYAAEHGVGLGQAMGMAWKDGRANFWQIIGYAILNALVGTLVVLFTCGIGSIVTLVQAYNANAFMYRQISGGAVPEMN